MGGLPDQTKELNPFWGLSAEFKNSFLKRTFTRLVVTFKLSYLSAPSLHCDLHGTGQDLVFRQNAAVVTKFYVKPSTILTHYDAKIMVSHVATDQL